jgi:hypothetical protein
MLVHMKGAPRPRKPAALPPPPTAFVPPLAQPLARPAAAARTAPPPVHWGGKPVAAVAASRACSAPAPPRHVKIAAPAPPQRRTVVQGMKKRPYESEAPPESGGSGSANVNDNSLAPVVKHQRTRNPRLLVEAALRALGNVPGEERGQLSVLSDEPLATIFAQFTIEDLIQLAQVNKALRQVLLSTIAEFVTEMSGVRGLRASDYLGIARIMGRLSAPRDWRFPETPEMAIGVAAPLEPVAHDVVTALGWRRYASPLGRHEHRAKVDDFAKFGKRFLRHYLTTLGLRVHAKSNPVEAFPAKSYVASKDAASLSAEHRVLLSHVVDHWRATIGAVPLFAANEPDMFARLFADRFGLRQQGQNISVVATAHPDRFLVYANNPIDPDIVETIDDPAELAARDGAEPVGP